MRILALRRQNVLATGGGRVSVVDDECDVVALVEDGVAHPGGESVVPEATIAHDADSSAPGLLHVQRGRTSCAQAIAHRRGTEVKGRQRCKLVAANISTHIVFANLPLDQLDGREDRPLWAAGAKRRRAR